MKTKIKQHYDENYGLKPPQNYERFFVPTIGEPVAKDLIRKADLRPGERLLDVACGTGIIARLALKKVGDEGTVSGLDINPGMLAVARSISKDLPIEWIEANAEKIPFEDESFDVVICQLGLQFMENRTAALQQMHRVLVPRGRLVLNVPGPAGKPFAIMAEAMERNISPNARKFVEHVFTLNDIEEIRKLVHNAGFDNVDIQAKNKLLSLPAPKDFFWQYIYSTPLAGVLAESDEEAKASLEEEVVNQWQQLFVDDNAFAYEQRIVIVNALK
jgi:ubiquinone/menaquinone biosynthesis C-methylase UbiE